MQAGGGGFPFSRASVRCLAALGKKDLGGQRAHACNFFKKIHMQKNYLIDFSSSSSLASTAENESTDKCAKF